MERYELLLMRINPKPIRIPGIITKPIIDVKKVLVSCINQFIGK